jgi:hypothetical protein
VSTEFLGARSVDGNYRRAQREESTMLAIEWTLTNVLWMAFLGLAVWICVVMVVFAFGRSHSPK